MRIQHEHKDFQRFFVARSGVCRYGGHRPARFSRQATPSLADTMTSIADCLSMSQGVDRREATASSTFLSGDGDGYEAQMGRWSRQLAPLLIGFAGVTAAGRVLDVGCGTGSLAFALAQNPRIGSIHGIDFSPVYIEHARQQARDSRLVFQVADARALPFEDASFDHSLASLVLPFIPDVDGAMREMRRVTRSGGTIAATAWDTRGGLVIYRMFFDTAAVLDGNANERRAKACTRPATLQGGMAKAWRDAGLLDVEQDSLMIRMEFPSFADFWTSLDGKDGPYAEYLATLSAKKKAKLRDAVKAAYLDGDPDGPRSYAATAWAVKGKVP
jgi:SAM-dependent methyltransferase